MTRWYTHGGVSRKSKRLHKHPSHPYLHPAGRRHRYPPTSRIRDRKGRKFRQTPQELQRQKVPGSFKARGGKTLRWD